MKEALDDTRLNGYCNTISIYCKQEIKGSRNSESWEFYAKK